MVVPIRDARGVMSVVPVSREEGPDEISMANAATNSSSRQIQRHSMPISGPGAEVSITSQDLVCN